MSTTYPKTFSIPSIIAVISAALSFTSGAILGFVFAAVAILAGLLGITLALSPRKRGGFVSTFAVVGGAVGVIAALVKAALWLF